MIQKNILFFALIGSLLLIGCNEAIDYSLNGSIPSPPTFSIEVLPDNPNRFLVTDLSIGNFTRVWDFGAQAKPKTSTLAQDTVLFTKKGIYSITLHVSAGDGNGTNYSEQTVTVAEDAAQACTETLQDLTNGCTSKCWRLSNEDGSVMVGPTPLSSEWFSSNGLEPTQLDDNWCLDYENLIFDYQNNGSSFSACQGYIEVPDYPIPANASFEYSPGTGYEGTDQIILSDPASWMGTEDSGPTYDVISVSESQLVLLAPIKPCDGSASNGFFTLTFLAAE